MKINHLYIKGYVNMLSELMYLKMLQVYRCMNILYFTVS